MTYNPTKEEILIEALLHLPYQKRIDLWKKLEVYNTIELKWLKANNLESITGIVSIGGDALADSEGMFDEISG